MAKTPPFQPDAPPDTDAPTTDTVDGMPAVIDGTVPRPQEPMVATSTDNLLIELGKREAIVRQRKSARGIASNALKEAMKLRDDIVTQLAERGVKLADPEAELPFDGDDEDDD